MSSTGTNTQTFTVADIRKVVECFSADYTMIAESTGLHTEAQVNNISHDIQIFAAARFIQEITIILKNAYGVELRGAKYTPSENASGWCSDRPGNAIWPYSPSGSLEVTVTPSQVWNSLTNEQWEKFKTNSNLKVDWPTTNKDISLSSLSRSTGQRYSSSGYGMQRTNYGELL